MTISFFHRKPFPFHQSIEKLFEEVREHLPGEAEARVCVAPHFSAGLAPRIRNILWARRNQGDVNHITGDIHYVALGLKKSKTILTIHDIGFIDHPNPAVRMILKLFWLTLPIKRSAITTVISETTKRHILRHVRCNPARIVVIPNAISRDWKRKDKPFNESYPTLLHVGTKFNKNLERTIRAIKGLSLRLKIIGKLTAEQEALLQECGIDYSAHFNISEAELMNHYETSDMLVFCSTLEGFGLPIIEAQTVGRPVATSKISAMPETAGEGACLVDPYDTDSIRQGILKVIRDREYRESLVEKGFANAKRFDPVVTARQYYEVYQKVWMKNK